MNRKEIIKKVCAKLTQEGWAKRYIPLILKTDPKNLSPLLMRMKSEKNLTLEDLGNFIQDLLIEKYHLHKKPEFKDALLSFAKENHIRGLQFHYL